MPARDWLFALPATPDALDNLGVLAGAAAATHKSDPYPISPCVFWVRPLEGWEALDLAPDAAGRPLRPALALARSDRRAVSFRAESPGLNSLLVASPRAGVRHLGVPAGGPADRAAWRLANALVGNPPDAVALEITLLGPTLVADAGHDCALVGAPFSLSVDGGPVEPGGAFRIRNGQTLRIGGTPTGARAILAVRGGFESPTILNGQSALAPVAAGDKLRVHPAAPLDQFLRLPTPVVAQLFGERPGELLALPGPERDWFPGRGVFDAEFTVEARSNRMGVRLGGRVPKRDGELRSGPVALGTVQVAHDGGPIVLGVDGQTIGGYPRAAQVVRASFDAIGQLRPGDAARFREVSLAEADDLYRARESRITAWLRRLALRG